MLLALCSAWPCAAELDRCRLIPERNRRQLSMDHFASFPHYFLREAQQCNASVYLDTVGDRTSDRLSPACRRIESPN